jgi:glycine/D-amino acid oxidase-like deaminating enzyme
VTSKNNYLIVGQGLAGSVLAWLLDQRGCAVTIINNSQSPSASKVSSGIFNPFAGKRLVKTWLVEDIFPFADSFYKNIENEFSTKLLHYQNIYRPFVSLQEQNSFLAQTAEPAIAKYVSTDFNSQKYDRCIKNPHGGIEFTPAGWVNTLSLLENIEGYFRKKIQYIDEQFQYQNIDFEEDSVFYNNKSYKKILFCEGFEARQNLFFDWLPFNPVKGEILNVQIEDYPITEIVNQGVWILPIDGTGNCRIGATYSWDKFDNETTIESQTELQQKVSNYLKKPYIIQSQQAGVRPATDDRRPFLGLHPVHKQLGIFNGLGTKGVTLAPFFADQFINFLELNKKIDPLVNIERCFSLYFRNK